jgi:ribonuclease Z
MLVFGPQGTVAMTENLTRAFSKIFVFAATTKICQPRASHSRPPGVAYDRNGVKVTAIEVNHGEKIRPAFGYVIEFDGKKVVLSGDTKPDKRVADAAAGADLLIHEVAIIEPELSKSYPSYRAIEDHHTSPEEAGRIFASAKPKLAVYSHIVFATLKPMQDVPEDALIQRTQTTYQGPFVIGRDLMSFVVSDKAKAFAPNGDAIQPVTAP